MDDVADIIKFIEKTLNEKTTLTVDSFQQDLKSGVVLCRTFNAIVPNSIPQISTKPLPFIQMENICNFLKACREVALIQDENLFQTVDLFEGKNMGQVCITLRTLARFAESLQSKKPLEKTKTSTSSNAETLTTTTKTKDVKFGTVKQLSSPVQITSQQTVIRSDTMAMSIATCTTSTPNTEQLPEPDFAVTLRQNQSQKNQRAVFAFIEDRLQEELPSRDLQEALKDGVILCRLVNQIKPDTIPVINKKSLPFFQMENIFNFLKAVKQLGVHESECFQTVDLYEGKDMNQVIVTLTALERISSQHMLLSPSPSKYSQSSPIISPQTSRQRSTPATTGTVTPSPPQQPVEQKEQKKPKEEKKEKKEKSEKHEKNEKNNAEKLEKEDAEARGQKLNVPRADGRATDYLIGNCIGRGHFGSVYRGLDIVNGEIIAIKRIRLQDANLKEINGMMKEVELLESLQHPNIVQYKGFLKTDTVLNICLEYVENGSLLHTLKAFGAFPESLVIYYAYGILQGLVYLHGRNVIHCDLKAANILTTKAGIVKLSDFGVSKEVTFNENDFSVAGTPNWMAPEVIELKGAATKSDVWSLGCTLIELLTTKPPYANMNAMTVLFRIVEDDHPLLPDDISSDLRDFFKCCFQKDLSLRKSASELLEHPWIKKSSVAATAAHTENHNAPAPLAEEMGEMVSILRETSEIDAVESIIEALKEKASLDRSSRKTTQSRNQNSSIPSSRTSKKAENNGKKSSVGAEASETIKILGDLQAEMEKMGGNIALESKKTPEPSDAKPQATSKPLKEVDAPKIENQVQMKDTVPEKESSREKNSSSPPPGPIPNTQNNAKRATNQTSPTSSTEKHLNVPLYASPLSKRSLNDLSSPKTEPVQMRPATMEDTPFPNKPLSAISKATALSINTGGSMKGSKDSISKEPFRISSDIVTVTQAGAIKNNEVKMPSFTNLDHIEANNKQSNEGTLGRSNAKKSCCVIT